MLPGLIVTINNRVLLVAVPMCLDLWISSLSVSRRKRKYSGAHFTSQRSFPRTFVLVFCTHAIFDPSLRRLRLTSQTLNFGCENGVFCMFCGYSELSTKRMTATGVTNC